CFSNASAKLQLGVLSVCSDCFSKSPNSSVTIGRLATVSYFSESGCLILPIVDSITCPVCWLFPKSNQYLGSSRLALRCLLIAVSISAIANLVFTLSTQEI